jgi:hypothetical protein
VANPQVLDALEWSLRLNVTEAATGQLCAIAAVGCGSEPGQHSIARSMIVVHEGTASVKRALLADLLPVLGSRTHNASRSVADEVTEHVTAFVRPNADPNSALALAYDVNSVVRMQYGLATFLDPALIVTGPAVASPTEPLSKNASRTNTVTSAAALGLSLHCVRLVAEASHWRVAAGAAGVLAHCCAALTAANQQSQRSEESQAQATRKLHTAMQSAHLVAAVEARLAHCAAGLRAAWHTGDGLTTTAPKAAAAPQNAADELDTVPVSAIDVHLAANASPIARRAVQMSESVFATNANDFEQPGKDSPDDLADCTAKLLLLVAESCAVHPSMAFHWACSTVAVDIASILAGADPVAHCGLVQLCCSALKELIIRTVADVPFADFRSIVLKPWVTAMEQIATAITKVLASPSITSIVTLPSTSTVAPMPAVLSLLAVVLEQAPRFHATCNRSVFPFLARSNCPRKCAELLDLSCRRREARPLQSTALQTTTSPHAKKPNDRGFASVTPMALNHEALVKAEEDDDALALSWEWLYSLLRCCTAFAVTPLSAAHAARLITSMLRPRLRQSQLVPACDLGATDNFPQLLRG